MTSIHSYEFKLDRLVASEPAATRLS